MREYKSNTVPLGKPQVSDHKSGRAHEIKNLFQSYTNLSDFAEKVRAVFVPFVTGSLQEQCISRGGMTQGLHVTEEY